MKNSFLFVLLIFGSVSLRAESLGYFVNSKADAKIESLKRGYRVRHLFLDWYHVSSEQPLVKESWMMDLEKNTRGQQEELVFKSSSASRASNLLLPLFRFDDPQSGNQYSLRSSRRAGMGVFDYYDEFEDSLPTEEVIVAVVDTGVEKIHPDLAENLWRNPGEIEGNGIDDDGNGYIDDIHGINTLVRDEAGLATVDVSDSHGHGTHVSGIIAGVQNNNVGIAGVSSVAKIMSIRAVPNRGDETDLDVVEAFLYAARNGARIINCSFGKEINEGGRIVSDAIDFIYSEYGSMVVAAAGNSATDIDQDKRYPASFENQSLIVVASTNKSGQRSWFSNWGEQNVDFAAPGEDVLSTVLLSQGGYEEYSGTSMSSPNTAAVLAQLMSAHPEMSGMDLKRTMINNVRIRQNFDFWFVARGWVDMLASFESLLD